MKRQQTFNAAVVGTLTVLCLGAWGGCAGGGYFTLPLAKAVGETGRVFAVDVEADMVKYVLAKRHEFLERQSFQIFVPGH